MTDNIVYIEFFNKKDFPSGEWMREPDYCKWQSHGYDCIAVRDMKLGMWRGFVALTKGHKFFKASVEKIYETVPPENVDIHGGISITGKLPTGYQELNKNNWWVGFDCSHGEDLMPLAKFDLTNPIFKEIFDFQTYKTFHFVRRETNKLARFLYRNK